MMSRSTSQRLPPPFHGAEHPGSWWARSLRGDSRSPFGLRLEENHGKKRTDNGLSTRHFRRDSSRQLHAADEVHSPLGMGKHLAWVHIHSLFALALAPRFADPSPFGIDLRRDQLSLHNAG